MKTYKKVEKDELDNIICDMCHQSCKKELNYEYMELYAKWGYSSDKDQSLWLAHFCEKCAGEIDSFISKNGGEIKKEGYALIV